jgi:hypothetical protein
MSPKAPRHQPARGMQERASGSNRQLPLYLIRIADMSRTLMELSVPEPPRAEFQTYLAQP